MSTLDPTDQTIESLYQTNQDTPDLPGTQRLTGITDRFQRIQQDRILQLKAARASKAIATVAATVAATGTPLQVTGVSATESPFKAQGGNIVSNVGVSFTVDPTDLNFGYAQVWFTGYNGSSVPQLISQGTTSPINFLCDTTDETVTVTVVAVGQNGTPVDFATAPTNTVLLDGVLSAPSAPSISGSLIGTPTGYQFSFNFLAGLADDMVDGYKVYRNTSNTFGTATFIQYFKHNPLNTGSQVVNDDGLKNGDLFWYWVTAVNTTGLESSSPTLVTGSGTVANGVALIAENFVRNGNFSAGTTNWNLANNVQASNFLASVASLPTGNTEFKSDAVSATLESVDFIPVDVNKTYQISCWAKIPAGTSVNYGGFAEYDSTKAHINHILAGAVNGYALFQALSVTSGSAWQYFSALFGGPTVSTPTQYQFAANTAYVRAIFLCNNSGTPVNVELTDVRISEVAAISIQALQKASGTGLISNPDFISTTVPPPIVGGNGSFAVYDNNASGKVTHSIVNLTTAPNSTGHVLQIQTASGAPVPSPGLGGFFVALTPDSGSVVLGSYHKGDTVLWRITANIPVGYTLQFATNPFGTEGTFVWVTSQAGTGGFYQYLAKQVIGTSGSFSTTGFFYLDSTSAAPVTWQIAVCEAIDISQPQLSNDIHHITRQGVSTKLLTQGSIVPTQTFTISFSTTTTSIALSWSSTSLFRADGSTFSVASGSVTYTGLTANTYFIYPYITYPGGVLNFTNANPPATSASATLAAQAGFDGRITLQPMDVQVTGSTSSGTGGDGGTCPESEELVEVQGKGDIRAIDVEHDDLIKGYSFTTQQEVFRRVIGHSIHSCAAWRMVDGHRVSPCEAVYHDGQWMPAYRVPGSTLDTYVGIKVEITIEADEDNEHNYYLSSGTPLLIHNGNILPRS